MYTHLPLPHRHHLAYINHFGPKRYMLLVSASCLTPLSSLIKANTVSGAQANPTLASM